MKCLPFLTQFDFLSNEVKLTIHKEDTRDKTVLGGILSVTSICITISFALYFFAKLLQKDSTFVSASTESSPFLSIEDSHNFPFLIRLTNELNKPLLNPERIYSIQLKYWKAQISSSEEEGSIYSEDIPIEKCSLNKHFGKYRSLFTDITDLDTFYCSGLRSMNQSIFGRYGDIHPYGYYDFYFVLCIDNTGCDTRETVDRLSQSIYVDFRTVDFSMNSLADKAKVETVLSTRYLLSSTVYKRIWMYLSGVKYITDSGLFFETETVETFSKFDSMRYDTDHRDILTGLIPGSFATLTVTNTGMNYIFNRHYLKIQEYLASIGGIGNFIQFIAVLLNYTFSLNSYYYRLMQSFNKTPLGRNNAMLSPQKTSLHHIIKPSILGKGEINDSKEHLEAVKTDSPKSSPFLSHKMSKWHFRLFPRKCLMKKDREAFQLMIDSVTSYMNVISILSKLEETHNAARTINFPRSRLKTASEPQLNCFFKSNKSCIRGIKALKSPYFSSNKVSKYAIGNN